MDIEVADVKEVTVVVPTGDLDTGSAPQLKQAFDDLLSAGRCRLVVDLAGVAYIDSKGLGELVSAMKWARRAGGDLRLCALTEDVFQIFEMTHLSEQMAIFPTQPEAVASWK